MWGHSTKAVWPNIASGSFSENFKLGWGLLLGLSKHCDYPSYCYFLCIMIIWTLAVPSVSQLFSKVMNSVSSLLFYSKSPSCSLTSMYIFWMNELLIRSLNFLGFMMIFITTISVCTTWLYGFPGFPYFSFFFLWFPLFNSLYFENALASPYKQSLYYIARQTVWVVRKYGVVIAIF